MNEPTPFALASVPAASTDPRLLTMHLDICRMRAELELLEGRISRIRASEAEAAADTRPFVDRAQDLVDRTVVSLLEAGRTEIEATERGSILAAEARVAEATRQARLLLAAAREELAAALVERAEAAEPVERSGVADVVILPDEGLVALPGGELVVVPDDDVAGLPADAPLAATGVLVVVEGDEVLLVLPEDAGETAAPVTAPAAPAVPTALGEIEAPAEWAPVAGAPAPEGPEVISSAPPPPPPPPPVAPPTEPPATAGSETNRADTAFDVWLAMERPADASVPAVDEQIPIGDAPSARSGWLRALVAAIALVLLALIVAISVALVH